MAVQNSLLWHRTVTKLDLPTRENIGSPTVVGIQNRNRRRDANEPIHGEFIHTTPVNEAQTDPKLHQPVTLETSHGCIHLKPVDIDDMIRQGYMRKNALVVVHRYADRRLVMPQGIGHAPFEIHFFPGMKQILVLGTRDY